MPSHPLAARASRILGDLDGAAARVRAGLPPVDSAELAESWLGEERPMPDWGTWAALPVEVERTSVLRAGTRGLEKIAAGNPDDVDPYEELGVEAIVLLEGRPAITVRGGDFEAQTGPWSVLEAQRDGIRSSIERVGRVEVAGHPDLDWVGTAFLVAPTVVMTNRHVAAEFASRDGAAWQFRPGMAARWDLLEELGGTLGGTEPLEFEVTGVLGVHEDDDVDLALLAVEPLGTRGRGLPAPVTLSTTEPADLVGRQVYVVGYPARDGRRNEPAEMRRIFADVYDVKRLQPGEATGLRPDGRVLGHDCSTLGGNSGSPVFDLDEHSVIGLHFGGRYGVGNSAVPVWRLMGDPLLARAGISDGPVGRTVAPGAGPWARAATATATGSDPGSDPGSVAWPPDAAAGAAPVAPGAAGAVPGAMPGTVAGGGGTRVPGARRFGRHQAPVAPGSGSSAVSGLTAQVMGVYGSVSGQTAGGSTEAATLGGAVPVPAVSVSGSQPAWLPDADRRQLAWYCKVMAAVGLGVVVAAVVLDAFVANLPTAPWAAAFAAVLAITALVVGYLTVAGFGRVSMSVNGGAAPDAGSDARGGGSGSHGEPPGGSPGEPMSKPKPDRA